MKNMHKKNSQMLYPLYQQQKQYFKDYENARKIKYR